VPLTGEPKKDIPELLKKIKRTGRFGHMRKSMGKKKMRKAAIAAALSVQRSKGKLRPTHRPRMPKRGGR
jgi:hypothetical protein